MNTRNNQEVFDHVCNIFIRDKKPQCMNDDTCVYAPQDDKQVGCAVGCLLENPKEWDALSDSVTVNDVFHDERKLYDQTFNKDQLSFLSAIQDFHDYYLGEFYNEIRTKRVLIDISDEYDLNLPDYVSELDEEE